VKRLVFCSGKVFVDLISSEQRNAAGQGTAGHSVALVRVEQLYPFPEDEVRQILAGYPALREVCWVQEEPENMGAWELVRPVVDQLIDGRWPLRYIGRARNSSPSEGSAAWHQANQRAIVAQTFEERADTRDADRVLSKQV
jgi:2-oxoglutarate dehydrogenase E1 component